MSQRQAKVESLVQQTVAAQLPDLLGPEVARVTVTAVDVSPDLRQATVWVGIVGDDKEAILEALQQQRPELQRRLADIMTTKFVPRITISWDNGGEYAAHISRLLGS